MERILRVQKNFYAVLKVAYLQPTLEKGTRAELQCCPCEEFHAAVLYIGWDAGEEGYAGE